MARVYRLTASISLPTDAFAEAAAVTKLNPLVSTFIQALSEEYGNGAKVEHGFVTARGPKRKTPKPALVPKPAA